MSKPRFREQVLHWSFTIGVWLKGIDGLLETAAGILFLLASRAAIGHFIYSLTQHQLAQDPDDLIANSLRHAFNHFSSGEKLFAAIYLLAHGAIKIFLVVCLLRNQLWAFPVTLTVLSGFIGYQIYRICTQFSIGLVALTVLDILVAGLIWHEYRSLKRRKRRTNKEDGVANGTRTRNNKLHKLGLYH